MRWLVVVYRKIPTSSVFCVNALEVIRGGWTAVCFVATSSSSGSKLGLVCCWYIHSGLPDCPRILLRRCSTKWWFNVWAHRETLMGREIAVVKHTKQMICGGESRHLGFLLNFGKILLGILDLLGGENSQSRTRRSKNLPRLCIQLKGWLRPTVVSPCFSERHHHREEEDGEESGQQRRRGELKIESSFEWARWEDDGLLRINYHHHRRHHHPISVSYIKSISR